MATLTLNPPVVNPTERLKSSRRSDRSFTDRAQWLEVRCSECGLLAEGDAYEIEASERVQRDHSDRFRGHRVNVELFFRECVSTRINETPKEADEAYNDPRD